MNKHIKKYLKFIYRWVQPFFDPIALVKSLPRYIRYIGDINAYSRMTGAEKINLLDTFPRIHERTKVTSFDKHYFYQDSWAFKKIFESKTDSHVDVGSSVQLIGYLEAITKVKFVDIRPIEVSLKNIEPIKGDILNMPFNDNSIHSLSCLSVAEHIGLGRYGDALDPLGTKKACSELSRILVKDGNLYFALPVGKPKVFFNAHRVHAPSQILEYFKGLKLVEFSAVDEKGNFFEKINPDQFKDSNFTCGLFWFTKE